MLYEVITRADIRKITEFLYILSLAQMWNLLAGYGGLLSSYNFV